MDLNSLRKVKVEDDSQLSARDNLLKAVFPSKAKKVFPNYVNKYYEMTKPEDQGSFGSCGGFATTTFVESLLWKLTGEKEEFSLDELYNIYLDTTGNDNEHSRTVPTSEERKTYRGIDGKWKHIPKRYEGILDYLTNIDDIIHSSYWNNSIYYWMIHYNDPEVRKNHYPDNYSKLCEKAKNYIESNICQFGSEHIKPNLAKGILANYGYPARGGLFEPDGHAVVMYAYTENKFLFDTSWGEDTIHTITLDYNQDYPYYTNPSEPNLKYLDIIQYYKDTISDDKKRITILSSDPAYGGTVYGVKTGDKFENGRHITLEAIPEPGKVLKRWSNPSWLTNPVEVTLTSDLSVYAEFTDNPADSHILYTFNMPTLEGGSVEGASVGDIFTYGDHIVLRAIPDATHAFVRWNDDDTNVVKAITVTGNVFAYPIFEPTA